MSDAIVSPIVDSRTPHRATSKIVEGWRILRAAIRGESLDLTTAPLGKALIMLAVPMIMEMIMESIFAVVDVFWVAHLGASAVAAVGLTESMMMILYAIAMGVSIGVMALVARRVGEKDLDAAG